MFVLFLAAALATAPSRPPFEHCTWQKLSDRTLGLEAWVQRCTSPKSDFVVQDHALAMRSADSPRPVPVIRLFDLRPGETPAQGLGASSTSTRTRRSPGAATSRPTSRPRSAPA